MEKLQTDFAMRESVTTIARLKTTVRSTGSRMCSGDCFCLRAIFQSQSIQTQKMISISLYFTEKLKTEHSYFSYSPFISSIHIWSLNTKCPKIIPLFSRLQQPTRLQELITYYTQSYTKVSMKGACPPVCTWFAIKELQAAKLYVKAVVCSGHNVFNVAGAHWQLRQILLALTGHLKRQHNWNV